MKVVDFHAAQLCVGFQVYFDFPDLSCLKRENLLNPMFVPKVEPNFSLPLLLFQMLKTRPTLFPSGQCLLDFLAHATTSSIRSGTSSWVLITQLGAGGNFHWNT
jgi:hypothetical protein